MTAVKADDSTRRTAESREASRRFARRRCTRCWIGLTLTVAQRSPDQNWTAERFCVTDQHVFGDAWRYELVDGRIIVYAAPSPEHRHSGRADRRTHQPVAWQSGRLASRERQRRGASIGTASDSAHSRRADPLRRASQGHVRGNSPSELRNWTQRDAKRRDLQAVGGAQGDRRAVPGRAGVAHLPPPARRHWSFEAQGGPDAILQLPSVGLAIPLSEIYAFAELSEPGADDPAADTRG